MGQWGAQFSLLALSLPDELLMYDAKDIPIEKVCHIFHAQKGPFVESLDGNSLNFARKLVLGCGIS